MGHFDVDRARYGYGWSCGYEARISKRHHGSPTMGQVQEPAWSFNAIFVDGHAKSLRRVFPDYKVWPGPEHTFKEYKGKAATSRGEAVTRPHSTRRGNPTARGRGVTHDPTGP